MKPKRAGGNPYAPVEICFHTKVGLNNLCGGLWVGGWVGPTQSLCLLCISFPFESMYALQPALYVIMCE